MNVTLPPPITAAIMKYVMTLPEDTSVFLVARMALTTYQSYPAVLMSSRLIRVVRSVAIMVVNAR